MTTTPGNVLKKAINYHNKWFLLNLAIILFSSSALFAKSLSLDSMSIVFYRTFLAFITLFILNLRRFSFREMILFSRREKVLILVSAFILLFHWFCFFLSIKYGSVAIGVITHSIFPLYLFFMEPLFNKKKFHSYYLLLFLPALAGVYLLFKQDITENLNILSIIYGMIGGFLFASFTLLNRFLVDKRSSSLVASWQNLLVATFSFLAVLFYDLRIKISGNEGIQLIALGVICTGFGHTLFIYCLKIIDSRIAGLFSLAEPLYAIILAALIIGEILSLTTIFSLILVLIPAVLATRFSDE